MHVMGRIGFMGLGIALAGCLSGAPVFSGTRVPIDALINNLEAGLTLDEFLDNFPTVTREQALQVLEFSKSTLLRLSTR